MTFLARLIILAAIAAAPAAHGASVIYDWSQGLDCADTDGTVEGYGVYVDGAQVGTVNDPAVTQYQVDGLNPGQTYLFQFSCIDDDGAESSLNPGRSEAIPSASPLQDWNTRSTAPGVLYANNFDSETDVTNNVLADDQASQVTWEQTLKTSGGGALRFGIFNTNTTNFGNWYTCWTAGCPNLQANEEIYIQFRQYTPAYLVNHIWEHSGSQRTGFKQMIISRGSSPGSNTPYEVVLTHDNVGFPIGYWQDGQVSARLMQDAADTECSGTDFRMQNVIDRGANPLTGLSPDGDAWTDCEQDRARYGGLYSAYRSPYNIPIGPADPLTGAMTYPLDGWATYMVRVRLGPSGLGGPGTLIQMWMARDGEDFTLMMEETNATLGPEYANGDGMNGFWLLPYISRGIAEPTRQDTFTVYDEVIVSTNQIPAPTAADAPVSVLQQTLDGLSPGQWGRMPGATESDYANALAQMPDSANNFLQQANAFVWDDQANRVMGVASAGSSNAHGLLEYDELQDDWIATVTPLAETGAAYDGNAIDVAGRKMYFVQYNDAQSNVLDLGSRQWSTLPAINTVGGVAFAHSGSWFPDANDGDGLLLFETYNRLQTWDGTAWDDTYTGEDWGYDRSMTQYHPDVGAVLIAGGTNAVAVESRKAMIVTADMELTALTDMPIGLELVIPNAFVAPLPGTRSWIIGDRDNSTWWTLDATQPGAVPVEITGSMTSAPAIGEARAAIVALPEHRAIMYLRGGTQPQVWLFKPLATVTDTQAPSTPAAPELVNTTTSIIDFSWNRPADNFAVVSYQVYRDGSLVGTTSATSYRDSGLAQGTNYAYRIRALDKAGNASADSPILNAATQGPGDMTGPIISSVTVASTTTNGGNVTFITNEAATCFIEYGETTGYGTLTITTPSNTSHSLNLAGMPADTLVNFRPTCDDTASNRTVGVNGTLTTQAAAASTEIGILLDGMSAGSWARLSLAEAGLASALNALPDTSNNFLAFTNQYVWDDQTNRIMGVGSAGNCCGGTSYGLLIYDAGTNTWQGETLTNFTGSGHAYSGNAIDVAGRRLFFSKYFDQTHNIFNLDSTAWTTWTDATIVPGGDGFTDAVAFFPTANNGNGYIVRFKDAYDRVMYQDGGSGAWSDIDGTEDYGSLHNVAVYHPTLDVVLGGGGNSESSDVVLIERDGATGLTATNITLSAGDVGATATQGFLIAMPGENFFIIGDRGTANWYSLNPTGGNGTVSLMSMTNAPSPSLDDRMAVVAIPGGDHSPYNSVALIKGGPTPEVWVYKHSNTQVTGGNDTTPPSTPPAPIEVSTTSTTANVDWADSTDDTGVTGYTVYRDNVPIGTTATSDYADTGLTASTTYAYSVAAYDAAGNVSPRGPPTNVTTDAFVDTTPPSTPPAPTVVGVTQASVALDWPNVADNVATTSYEVYRGGSLIVTVSASQYTDTGLAAATNYDYSLIAIDAAGNRSLQGPAVTATTSSAPDTQAPTTPGITAIATSATTASLSIAASSDNVGVVGYRIFRGGVEISNQSTLTLNDSGLSPQTSYSYTASAYDLAGNQSATSSPSVITTPSAPDTTPPTVPTITGAQAVSSTAFNLGWSASIDSQGTVASYRIFLNGAFYVAVSGTATTVTGLTASTTYLVSVSAVDNSGNESNPSSQVSVTTNPAQTQDTQPPTVPNALAGTETVNRHVSLTWAGSTDLGGGSLSGYYVYRNGSRIANTSGPAYTDTTTSVGGTFIYSVSAYDNSANESAQSIPVTVSVSFTPVSGGDFPVGTIDVQGFPVEYMYVAARPTTHRVDVGEQRRFYVDFLQRSRGTVTDVEWSCSDCTINGELFDVNKRLAAAYIGVKRETVVQVKVTEAPNVVINYKFQVLPRRSFRWWWD